LECADLYTSCEFTEKESSVVVVDDADTEMALRIGDDTMVGKALEESSLVGDECIFGCFSPRARTFPSA
jgi:hypothetical protein